MALELLEKRAFSGDIDGGYPALMTALETVDPDTLQAGEAARLVSALSMLLVQGTLPPAAFEGLIGHGSTIRHVFARSGFGDPGFLVGLVASLGADGNVSITSADQLEKILCLASVKHTPGPLLGMIPNLRPQAALQVSLHLLSDPDLDRIPSLVAFVRGLTLLFSQLAVSDELVPAFGPAFMGAVRYGDEGGPAVRLALQTALARWRAAKDWPALEPSPGDGPPVVVSAEAVDAITPDSVFFGPHAQVAGYAETICVRPKVSATETLIEQLSALRPCRITFVGHDVRWWTLLLAQLTLAPYQSSRDVNLHVETTPHQPEVSIEA